MNTALIGAAIGLELIPLSEDSIIAAIKDIIRARYHEMNLTAFKKGKVAPKRMIPS